MIIRPYQPSDKASLLAILDANTPQYFAPEEREDLIHYLDHEVEDYFVAETAEGIVGAGGLNYFPEEKVVRISWDYVHPSAHGQGVGRKLVEHRLQHVAKQAHIETVVVRTTQHVYRFYEKMGFTLVKTEKDFWAKGFDLYQMEQPNHQ